MAPPQKKFIHIPIEVKVRDFLPRLLFACFAVDNGFEVVIGHDRQLNASLAQLPRGLFFDKSLASNKHRRMQETVNAGFLFAAEDAESLSFYVDKPDARIRQRMSQETLGLALRFYSWGDYQSRAIRDRFSIDSSKLQTPGTIRTDILQPTFVAPIEQKAALIREKIGDYILFNSNLSLIHHLQGPDHIINQAKDFGMIKTAEDLAAYEDRRTHQARIKENILQLTRSLATRFPGLKLIVRPHPVEDPSHWATALAHLENAAAVYEGTSLEWMAGARALIHNGCTTAVEAIALGTPTVAYLKDTVAKQDIEITNKITETVDNEEALLERIDRILQSSQRDYQLPAEINSHFQNYVRIERGQFAAQRIAEDLKSLDWNREVLEQAKSLKSAQLPPATSTTHQIGPKLNNKKFSSLSPEEITRPINLWKRGGQFQSVNNVRQIAPNLFHLSP